MEPKLQTKIFATLVLWKLLLAQTKNSMTCHKFPNPGWHTRTNPVFTSAGLSCSPLMSFVLKGVGSPPHRSRSEAQRVRMMRQWRRCQDWKSEPLAFSPRLPFHSRAVHSCSLRNRSPWAPREIREALFVDRESTKLNCRTQLWGTFLSVRIPRSNTERGTRTFLHYSNPNLSGLPQY